MTVTPVAKQNDIPTLGTESCIAEAFFSNTSVCATDSRGEMASVPRPTERPPSSAAAAKGNEIDAAWDKDSLLSSATEEERTARENSESLDAGRVFGFKEFGGSVSAGTSRNRPASEKFTPFSDTWQHPQIKVNYGPPLLFLRKLSLLTSTVASDTI